MGRMLEKVLFFLVALSVGTTCALSQFLDLAPTAERPDIPEQSAVDEMSKVIRAEISGLRRDDKGDLQDGSGRVSSVRGAVTAYRSLVFKLLAEADAHPEADHLAVTGLCLGEMRSEIDRKLIGLAGETVMHESGNRMGQGELAGIFALLDVFSARARSVPGFLNIGDSMELDASLSRVLDPLVEALVRIEEGDRADPWPSHENSEEGFEEPSRMLEPCANEEIRELFFDMHRQFTARIEHPDLRREAAADARLLREVVEGVPCIEAAKWIPRDEQIDILARLVSSLSEWTEGDPDSTARYEILQWVALEDLIERTSELGPLNPRRNDIQKSVREVLAAPLEKGHGGQVESRIRRIALVGDSISADRLFRKLAASPPAPHLAGPRKSLSESYRRLEREVFKQISLVVESTSAISDPRLTGLIRRQTDLAEDLTLLERSEAWSGLVAGLAPQSLSRFNMLLRELGGRLAQPTRREEARQALMTLSRQMEHALENPFATPNEPVDPGEFETTGGRDRELQREFERSRLLMINDWLDGDPSDGGAARFEDMTDVLRRLDSMSEMGTSERITSIEYWGGWLMPRFSAVVEPDALRSMLKLAIEMLLAGDHEGLRRQLGEIDAKLPITRLALLIDHRLRGRFGEGPPPTSSRLDRVSTPPGRSALLATYRMDLARLARFTWETRRMNSGESDLLLEKMDEYCRSLADGISDEIGESPVTLPRFDPVVPVDGTGMGSMQGRP